MVIRINKLQYELGLNLYDFEARNYDPSIGRWLNIDPLAEKYPILSPYTCVANNPTNAIDPDGRDIIFKTKSQTLIYSKGNFYYGSITKNKNESFEVRMYDGRKEKVSSTLWKVR